ncbi:hypothetical protein IFR05_006454 [Cadophora sp. M221]|nr:hypothetical protein IFR05_006454 [Cadophora sp. M221]
MAEQRSYEADSPCHPLDQNQAVAMPAKTRSRSIKEKSSVIIPPFDIQSVLSIFVSSPPVQSLEAPLLTDAGIPADQRTTLETLVLYAIKKSTFLLADREARMNVGRLVINICRVLAFTATEITQGEIAKVFPGNLITILFPIWIIIQTTFIKQFGIWDQRLVKSLILDGTSYGFQRLQPWGLWPPSDASFELRQQFWELLFCPDIVELVLGGWHDKAVVDCQDQGVAKNCLSRKNWDDVVEHFEADVHSTWDGDPINFMSVDCHPGFGRREITDKSNKWKFLRSFTSSLRGSAPKALPPPLRQHLLENPPAFLGRTHKFGPGTLDEPMENSDDLSPALATRLIGLEPNSNISNSFTNSSLTEVTNGNFIDEGNSPSAEVDLSSEEIAVSITTER